MTVRTLTLPSHLLRWLIAPAILGALIATVASFVRLRTRQPSLPRMSGEWLHNLDRGGSRELDSWR